MLPAFYFGLPSLCFMSLQEKNNYVLFKLQLLKLLRLIAEGCYWRTRIARPMIQFDLRLETCTEHILLLLFYFKFDLRLSYILIFPFYIQFDLRLNYYWIKFLFMKLTYKQSSVLFSLDHSRPSLLATPLAVSCTS